MAEIQNIYSPGQTYYAGRKKPKAAPPMTMNERLTAKVTLLMERLYERRENLRTAVGEPFQSEKIPFEERRQQYQELKSSPMLMMKTLAANSVIGADGRLRISRKMLEALQELGDGIRT